MSRQTRKRVILAAGGLLVLAAVIYGFLPTPIPVQTARVGRGPLQVIVEEEGQTRLEDRYVISSPVPAFVRRIELEPGDRVDVGQPVAILEPPRATALDSRVRAQAAARVDAAAAAVEEATVVAERAAADRGRMERVYAAGGTTEQALEQAIAQAARANANLDAARADLAAARAALRDDGAAETTSPEDVLHSPVAGRVLRVHRQSAGHVNPGEPLIDIGNTQGLQVWVDVLSQDAVRIRPETRVLIDQWGGDVQLEAVVARVEPEAFTRVSALGVEEQRVPVVASFVEPSAALANLGSGYRVLARFIVWEADDVTKVPASALFRTEEGWAVFVVENGRAVHRTVQVGQQAGLVAQVVAGVQPGEVVVIHPPNEIEDGVRVRVREDA